MSAGCSPQAAAVTAPDQACVVVSEPARLRGDLELVVMYHSSKEAQASSGRAGESEEGNGKAEQSPGGTAFPFPQNEGGVI